MEKVKFNIDEDEVRILNQVNYNANAYHMFTLKSDSFYQNFIIILRPDFNILKIRSLPLGRGDKG